MKKRLTRILAPVFVLMLVALALLAPTGAEATPNSLKVSASNGLVSDSCEFTVTQFHQSSATVTGRLTIKGAEIKESFLAPRKVASLHVECTVYYINPRFELTTMAKTANASSIYKSGYVTVLYNPEGYQLCVTATYVLRDGTSGFVAPTCNPALPG